MKNPNWSSILELVPDALALAPELRGRFLDEMCRLPDGKPNEELRRHVEILIASSLRADESDAFASPVRGIVTAVADKRSDSSSAIDEVQQQSLRPRGESS